jgi:hypothetical protein
MHFKPNTNKQDSIFDIIGLPTNIVEIVWEVNGKRIKYHLYRGAAVSINSIALPLFQIPQCPTSPPVSFSPL